ncbi:transposase [Streptomyces tunisiensis]|uniref:transposase n=1 Tax=Streptomyces tunisiensis TaxID=948699 RepID=UPI003989F58E
MVGVQAAGGSRARALNRGDPLHHTAGRHPRKGIESSTRLGRRRWLVERTVSWLAGWLAGCRRLHCRYERKVEHFLAFVGIAAAFIGYRRLTN